MCFNLITFIAVGYRATYALIITQMQRSLTSEAQWLRLLAQCASGAVRNGLHALLKRNQINFGRYRVVVVLVPAVVVICIIFTILAIIVIVVIVLVLISLIVVVVVGVI